MWAWARPTLVPGRVAGGNFGGEGGEEGPGSASLLHLFCISSASLLHLLRRYACVGGRWRGEGIAKQAGASNFCGGRNDMSPQAEYHRSYRYWKLPHRCVNACPCLRACYVRKGDDGSKRDRDPAIEGILEYCTRPLQTFRRALRVWGGAGWGGDVGG